MEIYHALKKVLQEARLSTAVGDEGGFAPDLKDNEDALKVIGEAVEKAGYKFGKQIFVALDPAASELWDKAEKKGYMLLQERPRQDPHPARRWSTTGPSWCEKYPIRSIEDGLAENDWDGWKKLTDTLGDKIQLVGDDLFVTNVKFLEKGIDTEHRQLDPGQGQPDRHAHRDLRRREPGHAQRLHAPSSATAPARPRTRPSPTSPSPPTAARSRPAPRPAPTASPSTTSSSASKRSSATQPIYGGKFWNKG